jgi:hypothetical protein
MARAIMMVNISFPDLLAGIELRHSDRNERSLLELGLPLLLAKEDDSGNISLTLQNEVGYGFERLGFVQDALFKLERMGAEPRMGVMGKDPDFTSRKMGPRLEEVMR